MLFFLIIIHNVPIVLMKVLIITYVLFYFKTRLKILMNKI